MRVNALRTIMHPVPLRRVISIKADAETSNKPPKKLDDFLTKKNILCDRF